MKTYVEKEFNKENLKHIDIQNVGVYYSVPIENLYENRRGEFDFEEEETSVLLDHATIYDDNTYVQNYDNIEYDYTDEYENSEFIHALMNYKAYDHYLVVLFGATWNGASGYRFFDKYDECFYRDYDASMYVTGASVKGKCLTLREHHHDVPMGHRSIIIGLTENEYQKLENKDVQEIIEYAENMFDKAIEL